MKTITFYSYKGGVGRSLVLANLAKRLVEFGKSVCMLDFDLEAPGLPFKFDAKKILAMNKKGIVDFVTEYQTTQKPPQTLGDDYAIWLNPESKHQKPLHLITAGNTNNAEFWKNLAAIDWKDMFYSQQGQGYRLILHLKALIEKEIAPDYLLVDSRTGVTETSGIALSVLADRVVIVAANNEENIYGSKLIMKGLLNNPMQEVKPDIHFVLSRVPFTNEPKDRVKEEQRVDELLKEFKSEQVNVKSDILLIHSDRELEEKERLKIGTFGRETKAENEILIGEDYRNIFGHIFVMDFDKVEFERYTNQEIANGLFFESMVTTDLNVALSLLDRCIALYRNPDFYDRRSYIKWKKGANNEAIDDIKEALALNPNDHFYHYELSSFYIDQKRFEDALSSINNAIQLSPEDYFYYETRGEISLELGNMASTEEDLKKAIQLAPNESSPYIYLALYYFDIGKLENSFEVTYKALQSFPENNEILLLFAQLQHSYKHNKDEFYINLERALLGGDEYIKNLIANDEFFRPLLSEERFQRILYKYNIKMKLPEKPADENQPK